jgi:hypothetical protein
VLKVICCGRPCFARHHQDGAKARRPDLAFRASSYGVYRGAVTAACPARSAEPFKDRGRHPVKTRIRLLTIVLIAAAVAVPGLASAEHAWGNYHWERASNPVKLTIGDNVSSVWDGHLDAAIADWSKSDVLSLTEVAGAGGRRCKAQSGRIEVCNGSYGNNGWLGIASISVSGDHITAATTKMNDTYFSSGAYNTDAWRQMVMCQEIGHAFGLGHQDEAFDNPPLGTCMDYTSDPDDNQHPNSHDYTQLAEIYAELDSGSTDDGTGGAPCPGRKKSCRQGNNGVAGSDLVGPGEWGQLVREEGRHAIYERDFGSGNRVVTFVTWAD